MKTIKPDYSKFETDDILFAYVKKRKPRDIFPAYYQGYDKNWDEYQWADGEGTMFSDVELFFCFLK